MLMIDDASILSLFHKHFEFGNSSLEIDNTKSNSTLPSMDISETPTASVFPVTTTWLLKFSVSQFIYVYVWEKSKIAGKIPIHNVNDHCFDMWLKEKTKQIIKSTFERELPIPVRCSNNSLPMYNGNTT